MIIDLFVFQLPLPHQEKYAPPILKIVNATLFKYSFCFSFAFCVLFSLLCVGVCVCVFLFVCVVLVVVFSVHRILQLHKMYFIILHQNNFGVKE